MTFIGVMQCQQHAVLTTMSPVVFSSCWLLYFRVNIVMLDLL